MYFARYLLSAHGLSPSSPTVEQNKLSLQHHTATFSSLAWDNPHYLGRSLTLYSSSTWSNTCTLETFFPSNITHRQMNCRFRLYSTFHPREQLLCNILATWVWVITSISFHAYRKGFLQTSFPSHSFWCYLSQSSSTHFLKFFCLAFLSMLYVFTFIYKNAQVTRLWQSRALRSLLDLKPICLKAPQKINSTPWLYWVPRQEPALLLLFRPPIPVGFSCLTGCIPAFPNWERTHPWF